MAISRSRISSAVQNAWTRFETELEFRKSQQLVKSNHSKVIFCPSDDPVGASLLRAYNLVAELRSLGWNAICLPKVIKASQRERLIKQFDPHVLVFQQCRHALNDINDSFGYPVVLDTDDADFHLEIPGLKERLDRTSRGAVGVMVGSQYLKEWHLQRCQNTEVIWTGSPSRPGQRKPHSERDKILVWAQAAPLSYTSELKFVLELDKRLRNAGSDHKLRFYGIGTAEEEATLRGHFDDAGHVETVEPLSYDDFLLSLQDAAVGISPIISQSPFSRGKSFGKILGYLDAWVPSVVSDEADHAAFFSAETGVVSNDIAVWEEAILRLLDSPYDRTRMASAAFDAFDEHLSLRAAARKTDRFLRETLSQIKNDEREPLASSRSD